MEDTTKQKFWTIEADRADIAWLGLRCPGAVNTLSNAVLSELDKIIDALLKAPPKGLIIFSHKKKGFIAGADINEFQNFKNENHVFDKITQGQDILKRLSSLPFPKVAAINGPALGGGLELALSCDYRIAFNSNRRILGLPEVQLGLNPAFGGCVRSIRLIGVREAMKLILTGKPINVQKALAIGLIDRITSEKSWRADAADLVFQRRSIRIVPILDILLNLSFVRPIFSKFLIKNIKAKVNNVHYPAPFAIIELWKEHGNSNLGYQAEAKLFSKLAFSETSKNLVKVYFLQSRLKRFAKSSNRKFNHVHVIGAGKMGGDIAAWCAFKGLQVTLQDREKRYIDNAFLAANKTFNQKLKQNNLIDECMNRLTADIDGKGLSNADVIIEAVYEDLDVKQSIFSQIEQKARSDALIASNTSSIPLKDIATSLQTPSKLIGLHFFNPVSLMPLIEVVHSRSTQPHEIAAGTSFVRRIGKLPLPCLGMPGFLVNRILGPYIDEAIRALSEGIPAEAIDRSARDFGMPVGPLELADSVGLDIVSHVAINISDTVNRVIPKKLEEMIVLKKLGLKTGSGFYEWKNNKPLIRKTVNHSYNQDIQDRLILSLCNEAVSCLNEGIVDDADLIDAGVIFGAGFAPFRAGPLQYINQIGAKIAYSKILELEKKHGKRFTPSAGWDKLLKSSFINS